MVSALQAVKELVWRLARAEKRCIEKSDTLGIMVIVLALVGTDGCERKDRHRRRCDWIRGRGPIGSKID